MPLVSETIIADSQFIFAIPLGNNHLRHRVFGAIIRFFEYTVAYTAYIRFSRQIRRVLDAESAGIEQGKENE